MNSRGMPDVDEGLRFNWARLPAWRAAVSAKESDPCPPKMAEQKGAKSAKERQTKL